MLIVIVLIQTKLKVVPSFLNGVIKLCCALQPCCWSSSLSWFNKNKHWLLQCSVPKFDNSMPLTWTASLPHYVYGCHVCLNSFHEPVLSTCDTILVWKMYDNWYTTLTSSTMSIIMPTHVKLHKVSTRTRQLFNKHHSHLSHILTLWKTLSKWRKLVVKSSVVPQRPSRLRDRWWW